MNSGYRGLLQRIILSIPMGISITRSWFQRVYLVSGNKVGSKRNQEAKGSIQGSQNRELTYDVRFFFKIEMIVIQ